MADIGKTDTEKTDTGKTDGGRRVVVGMDLTPLSRHAISEAARFAEILDAELEVVCVHRDEFDRTWAWPALASEEEVRRHTEEVVDDVLRPAGTDALRVAVSIVQGSPAHTLIDRARDAELLVVGGRRGGVVAHMMLGSVATQCVEYASVPVLVVPDPSVQGTEPEDRGPSAGRVVVGVDGSPSSIEALRWARTVADLRRTGIDALAVWTPPMYTSGIGYAAAPELWDGDQWAKETLHTAFIDAFGSSPPEDLQGIVESGYPSHHLLERSRGAAALVVGNRGRGGFTSLLLGSVSLKCVNNARCPVLVVHAHPAEVDAPDQPE